MDNSTSFKLLLLVPSKGTYNYRLAKYLCEHLSLHLPMDLCTEDSFTFVEEINLLRINNTLVFLLMSPVYLLIF